MPTKSRAVSKKSTAKSKRSQPKVKPTGITASLLHARRKLAARKAAFLDRRPHRSFRRTYRRDYKVEPNLPGYFAFTAEGFQLLKKHWRRFLVLIVIFTVLYIALSGLASQQSYRNAQDVLRESGSEIFSGSFGKLGEAGLLLVTAFSGSNAASDVQQVYLGFVLLLVWLATVWLLRELLGGNLPRVRDAIYNSGAPIVSTGVVTFILMLQLLPVGILALAYSGLASVGLIDGGFGAMLFALISIAIVALVLYWTTSTLLALVIVTLPGMYPFRALRAAGDLAVGIRLTLLYRILWLIGTIALLWLVLLPVILFDTWLKSVWAWYDSMPLVPILAVFFSILSIVWASTYIYLLYRKLVDYGAKRR